MYTLYTPYTLYTLYTLSTLHTKSVLSRTHMSYKISHISGAKRSPEMIVNAFHVKFHAGKNGYLPGPVDFPKQIRSLKKNKNKMHQEMGSPPARPPVRPPGRGVQGRSPPGCRGLGAQLSTCRGGGDCSPPGCEGSGGQRPPGISY